MEEVNSNKTLSSHGLCIHSSTESPCPFCLEGGVYNARHGEAINKNYKDGRNESSEAFDTCFDVLKEFYKWLEDHGCPDERKKILEFLRDVNKSRAPLKWREQTLKKSYYVAKHFPDLEKPAKRILSLSCYKELARDDIGEQRLKEIRSAFEVRHVKAQGNKEDPDYISVDRLKRDLASIYGVGRDFSGMQDLTVQVKNKTEFIRELRLRLRFPRSSFKNRTIKVLISFDKEKPA
jgi:hypothetical protein